MEKFRIYFFYFFQLSRSDIGLIFLLYFSSLYFHTKCLLSETQENKKPEVK